MVSCDGVFSEVLSKRFDRDVEGFLRGLSEGYILEEVVLMVVSVAVSVYIQYQECVQS